MHNKIVLYPSAWADQRGPLGDKQNTTGRYKKYHPVVLGVRQLAFFKAFY